MQRRRTGILGEHLAQEYLKRKGYIILETNYRCPEGEIDIIARCHNNLVFCEVRTKTGIDFGTPEESITYIKKRHLERAVYHYLKSHNDLTDNWPVDFIAVELDINSRLKRVEHLQNAFEQY